MPSYYTLTTGTTAQAQDVNQLINAMNGSAGNGIPTSLTAVNDSVNFSLAVKNADPTNSRALQVLRANNNVLIQADANGVIVSPDGGATTGQVVTVNATQTQINKTFTSPVVSGGISSPAAQNLTLTAGAGGVVVPGLASYVTAVSAGGALTANVFAAYTGSTISNVPAGTYLAYLCVTVTSGVTAGNIFAGLFNVANAASISSGPEAIAASVTHSKVVVAIVTLAADSYTLKVKADQAGMTAAVGDTSAVLIRIA